MSELGLRALSTAVLMPVAVGVLIFGGWTLIFFVTVIFILITVEWSRLMNLPLVHPSILIQGAGGVAILILVGLDQYSSALMAFLILMAVLFLSGGKTNARRTWLILGLVFALVPAVAVFWLRDQTLHGREMVLWFFALVWATDVGAYACGNLFKGPKLIPRISPNKTWAGFLGGTVSAVAVGFVGAVILEIHPYFAVFGLSILLAVLCQLGDLTESLIKRHFHAKDSGNLIPGHGGVMDRADSLLFTAPFVAALSYLQESMVV